MAKKRVQNYTYKISDVLGQGSFGIVYLGQDDKTKQQVAIKVLNKKKINLDQYMREALKLQIKILNRIKSQNIVRFRDVIETSNNYYIMQQYCNEGDLAKLIKNQLIQQKVAIKYMAQILTGFYELIRQGIVHRDMKPQNILLKNGILKIADFGLARPTHDEKLLQSAVGTPLYQSPQLLSYDKYTYKCDVWALGLIFYEMLYGKLPWKSGGNIKTLLDNIKKQKLVFPQEPVISKQVKQFIAECLTINEDDRADWEAIYSSIIFKGMLPKYEKLKEVFNYTLTKLRQSIHENNLNLEMFFKGQKLDAKSSLNRKQFFYMMYKISSNLTDHQIEYMFNQFDEDRNGMVQFYEFKKCLQAADIRTKSMNRRDLKKILSIQIEEEVDKVASQKQQQLINVVEKLRVAMQAKQIYDIYELFINQDAQRQGYLSFKVLLSLLRKIENNIDQEEGKIIFQKFDENGDGKISFSEFYKNMCVITGSPIISESKKIEH